MNKHLLNIFLLLAMPAIAVSQEIITGLQVNSRVKQMAEKSSPSRRAVEPLLLPFFDDFSDSQIFPHPSRWSDNDAFINDDYAVNPPTVGVATLDAIDSQGRLYSNASPFPYMADFLTSQPIRLDSLFTPVKRIITRADSLYLSFYYQPQGFGNVPAKKDSLILEFLAPGETRPFITELDTIINGVDTTLYDTTFIEGWRKVWSDYGQSLKSFYAQDSSWFRQVLVPVDDSAMFYTKEFRFRFRNFASLASGILPDWQSNGDQWNIDYVYLNIGRNNRDTLHKDVAFAAKAPPMLKNYTSMPYNQFRPNVVNEMKTNLEMRLTNLDKDNYNISYGYSVSQEYKPTFYSYSGGNFFIPPYITSGYSNHLPFATPPVNFKFPILTGVREKIFFTTTHVISTEANLMRRQNDTVRHVQVFANYLSYDDGTAEAGHGLSFPGAQLAYKFKLNRPDSLMAVQMYFNQTLKGGNIKSFYLNVWNDYFGDPGELIYSRFGYEPAHEDSLNKFFTYQLDSILKIEAGRFPNLIFYVGYEQTTADNLNIGYDFNNDASTHTYFNTAGKWRQSIYPGALMIRPVLGKLKVMDIPENEVAQKLKIYPNPASTGLVWIDLPGNMARQDVTITITATDGKTLLSRPYQRETDISMLAPGFYIIQLTDRSGNLIGREKLIVNR